MTADPSPSNTPDPERLDLWMAAHVPGYRGPVRAELLAGGQSNPTFRLLAASGDYVLRRKPVGALLKSAHQVDREFRVLSGLANTPVKVPRVHAICMDESVLGSTFYVMEFIPGRVFFDARLPGLSNDERAAIFASMADVIATLHAVDPDAAGLGDYGRPVRYMERQLARWSQQYRLSETAPIPAMDRLLEWLPGRLPDSGYSGIVHGDLRLDNMLIHPTEPRVMAVLDWELSTLGDPWSDIANNALAWRLEPDLFRGVAGVDLAAIGVPTERDYVAEYCRRIGRPVPEAWEIYIVFNLFRLAAIIQGIAKRSEAGTASDPAAAALGKKAAPIAERAWDLAGRLSLR